MKVICRFFYAPICPESFRTLYRLEKSFKAYDNYIDFQGINIYRDEVDMDLFEKELDIISRKTPLLFGKLFVNGKEIKGFPPSRALLEKALLEYDIDFSTSGYSYEYAKPSRGKWLNIQASDVIITPYSKHNIYDACLVCTKHHPYLDEKAYKKHEWFQHEADKKAFIKSSLVENKVTGLIAYYHTSPLAFIEAFPVEKAHKLGFPVSNVHDNGIMITCLSVMHEVERIGIAKSLIVKLEELVRPFYPSIEVLAFPDEKNWQPKSLYHKLGYKAVKELDGLYLMRKDL